MPEEKDPANKPPIWRDRYQVRSYDVDMRKNMTLISLCNYLTESAWNHAEALELGYTQLLKQGQFWVLSRLFIEIDHYPKWQEHISIETWSKGTDGIFALRDFTVLDEEEKKIIIRATSGWLILDIHSRRPQRLDYFLKVIPFIKDKNGVEHKLLKLPAIREPDVKSAFTVGYNDLDLNRHVTATKYIEWILNSLPFEYLTTRTMKSFEIDFLAESQYGDEIMVLSERTSENDIQFLLSVRRKSDNRDLCRSRIVWN